MERQWVPKMSHMLHYYLSVLSLSLYYFMLLDRVATVRTDTFSLRFGDQTLQRILMDIHPCPRLYQYIHGANGNSSRLKKTSPILTSIDQVSANATNYSVRFYLPQKYEGVPLQPYPKLTLQIEKWRNHCIAVKKFSGFAKDDNINTEKEGLLSSLDKLSSTGQTISVVLKDSSSCSVAQYNASFHLFGRLNEVWMNVSAEGCPIY